MGIEEPGNHRFVFFRSERAGRVDELAARFEAVERRRKKLLLEFRFAMNVVHREKSVGLFVFFRNPPLGRTGHIQQDRIELLRAGFKVGERFRPDRLDIGGSLEPDIVYERVVADRTLLERDDAAGISENSRKLGRLGSRRRADVKDARSFFRIQKHHRKQA